MMGGPTRHSNCVLIASLVVVCALGSSPAFARQNNPGGATESASSPAQHSASQSDAATAQLPETLTVPAGTLIRIRTFESLSSDHNKPGDKFTATLEQPVVVSGWIVARRGQLVVGRVAVAKKAGRFKGTSKLGVELSRLILADGQQLPIQTQLYLELGRTPRGHDAKVVGTTTGVGAIIGGSAKECEGMGGVGTVGLDVGTASGSGAGSAEIVECPGGGAPSRTESGSVGAAAAGSVVGAAVGVVRVLSSRGQPTVLPPGTDLSFQLQAPASFSTARNRPAFRPVSQADHAP